VSVCGVGKQRVCVRYFYGCTFRRRAAYTYGVVADVCIVWVYIGRSMHKHQGQRAAQSPLLFVMSARWDGTAHGMLTATLRDA
jgi:hypothetical protein